MIAKRFEDITFSDLEALLDNQVAEGKTIEYKREVITNASSDKEPFLAGVNAFANTVGGDFIIGIDAEKGIPINLTGASYANADDEILKLEQFLQNGLEPRLPSVQIKEICAPDQRKFIIVRAARSWIAPHKVKANEKFYGRNSKGKYPLDVSELRTAFMLSEQITQKIRNFRTERVLQIKKLEELPFLMPDGAKLILHLIPLSAFSIETEIDVINSDDICRNLQPMLSGGWNNRINLDGFVTFWMEMKKENIANSYTQIFRNGIIEAVASLEGIYDSKILNIRHVEEEMVLRCKDYLKVLSVLKIEAPIFVFLTISSINGFSLYHKDVSSLQKYLFNRNDIILPEKMLGEYEKEIGEIMKPLFDAVWNAFGYKKSPDFDDQGKWVR